MNIFNILPVRARVAVMYFMVKSCLHVVINYLQLPEPDHYMPYLFTYHRSVPNSTKFCKNVEIPRKWANFTAWLKILHTVELWCLFLADRILQVLV